MSLFFDFIFTSWTWRNCFGKTTWKSGSWFVDPRILMGNPAAGSETKTILHHSSSYQTFCPQQHGHWMKVSAEFLLKWQPTQSHYRYRFYRAQNSTKDLTWWNDSSTFLFTQIIDFTEQQLLLLKANLFIWIIPTHLQTAKKSHGHTKTHVNCPKYIIWSQQTNQSLSFTYFFLG